MPLYLSSKKKNPHECVRAQVFWIQLKWDTLQLYFPHRWEKFGNFKCASRELNWNLAKSHQNCIQRTSTAMFMWIWMADGVLARVGGNGCQISGQISSQLTTVAFGITESAFLCVSAFSILFLAVTQTEWASFSMNTLKSSQFKSFPCHFSSSFNTQSRSSAIRLLIRLLVFDGKAQQTILYIQQLQLYECWFNVLAYLYVACVHEQDVAPLEIPMPSARAPEHSRAKYVRAIQCGALFTGKVSQCVATTVVKFT